MPSAARPTPCEAERPRHSLVAALALALWLGGCAGPWRTAPDAPDTGPLPASPVGVAVDAGVASWYGERFHGRRTASGEPFNMHELTAAHPTLPFGTRVRVRNLDNGREVVVRINDRGPFSRGRVIDLSRAAASVLGFVQAGTARVSVRRD